ncbi:MAG: DNA polymerase [Candidatus Saccharimonadaceae bacterium]
MIYLITRQIALFDSELFTLISLQEGIDLLKPHSELGLDTETEGLDPYTKKLLLLQIGIADFQVLFDIASYNGIIPPLLREYLNKKGTTYILQNAKFDLKFLYVQEVILKKVYDTMLAEIILTNGLQYSGRDLGTLVMKYCGVFLDKSVRGDIIKFGLSDAVLVYGARDVEFLPKIKEEQLKMAIKSDLLTAIDLDNSFVLFLAYTEYCGIKLNFTKWKVRTAKSIAIAHELKCTLEKKLLEDGKTKYFSGMLDMFTGEQECIINWDSPKQVAELFDSYGINTTIKDKGESKTSIDAKVITPQAYKFPILVPYLEYKAKQKEISTYGEGWRKNINPVTKRIHTTFQQLMDTGRLSSGNKRDGTPNLQNIPKDEETRSCFIPEEGNVMIDADYSSQEQIILANFTKEPGLINFYAKGFKDMHSYVAFLMYPLIRKCSLEELTPEGLKYIAIEHKEKRTLAKNAGFAINYGGNGATIAANCNIPVKDGIFVYESYFTAFPLLKNYFEYVFLRAAYFGHIQFNTITRRKYFFDLEENDYFANRDEVEGEFFWQMSDNPKETQAKYNKAKSIIQRTAQNYPIQGTAADITKYAGILFFKQIIERGWWMIVKSVNLIHDELLVECPKDMREEVQKVLIDCMEAAGVPFCNTVTLRADAVFGDHWVH